MFTLNYNGAIQLIKEYEENLSDKKKAKGAYYTHPDIAKRVVKESLAMLFQSSLRHGYDGIMKTVVCDPACGAGIFLVETVVFLIDMMNGGFDHRIGCKVSIDDDDGEGYIIDVDPDGIHVKVRAVYRDAYGDASDPEEEWISGFRTRGKRIGLTDTWEKEESFSPIDQETVQKIATSCIRGFDIDPDAVCVARRALGILVGLPESAFEHTILDGDFLFDDRVRYCDAFVGNPPFLGGSKISGIFGKDYLKKLKDHFFPAKGPVDYCAYFFRRASYLLFPEGVIGFIATNTISQGATRRAGLEPLLHEDGLVIYKADRSWSWPGTANVTVSTVYLTDNWLYKTVIGTTE